MTTRNRLCLITGATAGIGRASALALAGIGFDLVLLGRSRQRGEALQGSLARRHAKSRFQFVQCDLSSLESVRDAAARVRRAYPAIDVLINNAGARFDRYAESIDGFELTFATNHLGHFLLTALLLEPVLCVPNARVITVSSQRHRSVGQVESWLSTRESFNRWDVYSKSKLANTLFAFELGRRLRQTHVVSNAVDPGVVASNFARNNGQVPWLKHIVWNLSHRQLVSCSHAAQTVVYAAASAATAGKTGKYFYEQSEATPSELALDRKLAAELWKSSLEWTGLNHKNCQAWTVFGTD